MSKVKSRMAEREHLQAAPGTSLRMLYSDDTHVCSMQAWHYHPEIEMVLVPAGKGAIFMADVVKPYTDGFIILMHTNIPHFSFDHGFEGAFFEQYVVQILPEHLERLLTLPEFEHLRPTLQAAKSGLLLPFGPGQQTEFLALFKALFAQPPIGQLLHFVEILDKFAQAPYERVAHVVRPPIPASAARRLEVVYAYIAAHFAENIASRDAARLLHLTDASFCRFFQKHTNTTFKEALTAYRLAHACKLLAHTDNSIEVVAYESGFGSQSYFQRTFRRLQGITPLEYRRQW